MLLGVALAAIAALIGVTLALRKSLERERRLARTDVVTGVRTARAFYEAAAAEIERARRYQHPFSVAAVHLGHRVPDELLRATAVALRLALRATDFIARLGRDEFVVLLPETSAPAARVVLEKLRAGLSDTRSSDGRPVVVTIGGVTFVDPPTSVDEIVRGADERITEAKTTGTPSHSTWNQPPPPPPDAR
ncbi:MAG TPA: GGDEF domain-containing protein [Gemmatimonadales bacterium]|nr:GGDEF domain-containing protein [Gemmatimonadales bacterium]